MIGKKREDWKSVVFTAALCGVFLYWWFRPAAFKWEHQSPEKLVERAMAEPPPATAAERELLDFDLLETAILQGRLGMAPEGLVTAKKIADPVIQARTIRQLAQAHLNSDAARMGDALAMCDAITDPALRGRMRDEVLLQIAMLGFADVVLPEAKTPLLRARLARTMLETDGQEAGRKLLTECEAGLPSLPPEEAAAVSFELAYARVWLSLAEGPAQAFAAIEAQPESARGEMWQDLFGVCCGRGDTAEADTAAVIARVKDPAIVRKLRLEALRERVASGPEDPFLEALQREAATAAIGEPRIRALMTLGDARGRATGTEAASPILRKALEETRALRDPVLRANLLADLSPKLSDALMMEDAAAALVGAADSARGIVAPDHRLPVLDHVMREAFNGGNIRLAADLADEAVKLSETLPSAPASSTRELTDFLTRLGDWASALRVISRLPEAERKPALDAMAQAAAEDCIGYDPAGPTPRGQPLDRIRELSLREESGAAFIAMREKPGLLRTRAWLAMAKGQLLPSVSPTADPGAGDSGSLPPGFNDEVTADGPDAANPAVDDGVPGDNPADDPLPPAGENVPDGNAGDNPPLPQEEPSTAATPEK